MKLHLLTLLVLTLAFWGFVIRQVPLSEGYYYFNPLQNHLTFTSYDNFAKYAFSILIPLFGDHIYLYMAFQLLTMVLLNLTLYLVLVLVTGNATVAWLATVLFATSYLGSFEMYALGNYQRFIQRVPNLIPLLVSFLFLYKSFQYHKLSYSLISYFLFSLALVMGHYSFFLLPLMLAPALYFFTPRHLLIAGLFALTAAILVHGSNVPINPAYNLRVLIPNTIVQIPALTLPVWFLRSHAQLPSLYLLAGLEVEVLLVTIYLAIRRHSSLVSALIIFPLALVGEMALYILVDERFLPLSFGQSRYYFLASLLYAVVLACVLVTWLSRFKITSLVMGLLMLLYLALNYHAIRKQLPQVEPNVTRLRNFIVTAKAQAYLITPTSIVILPSQLMWTATFISRFYHYPDKGLLLPNPNWEQALYARKAEVFVYDYDPHTQATIDLTSTYRNLGHVTFNP